MDCGCVEPCNPHVLVERRHPERGKQTFLFCRTAETIEAGLEKFTEARDE
jgi:hypothetical protein